MSDPSKAATALTIMIIDVVGSTALRRARGDADTDDILALLAGLVHDKVTAFGGRVRTSHFYLPLRRFAPPLTSKWRC